MCAPFRLSKPHLSSEMAWLKSSATVNCDELCSLWWGNEAKGGSSFENLIQTLLGECWSGGKHCILIRCCYWRCATHCFTGGTPARTDVAPLPNLSAVWGQNTLRLIVLPPAPPKQPVVHLRKRFCIKSGAKWMPAFSSHSKRDESTGWTGELFKEGARW